MHLINVAELVGADWRFLEPICPDPGIGWDFHSLRPRNLLEAKAKRFLGVDYRLRPIVQAARRHPDAVLVSHLPGVTLALARVMRRAGLRCPHVAWAFNYTTLPAGRRLMQARTFLPDVTEFVVSSRAEIALYADLLHVPPERFHFLPWAIDTPAVDRGAPPPFPGRYLSAIGGEGRDYALLAEAMRRLPDVPLAIVARPYSIAGIAFPENVRVFTDLIPERTWAIGCGSAALAVPLKTARTPNGHISIIAAQRLGIPLVVTRSTGVADYVDDSTARMVEAGDAGALAAGLRAAFDDPAAGAARAAKARDQAARQNDPANHMRYFLGLEARLRTR